MHLTRTQPSPWGGSVGLAAQCAALDAHAREILGDHRVITLDADSKRHMDLGQVLEALQNQGVTGLLVSDPLACAGHGPLGLARAWRIRKAMSRLHALTIGVVWDSRDPLLASIFSVLLEPDDFLISPAASSDALRQLGYSGVTLGPAPEIGATGTVRVSATPEEWQQRPIDVLVSRSPHGLSHDDVRTMRMVAQLRGLSLTVLDRYLPADAYVSLLQSSKYTIVSNKINPDYLRHDWARSVSPFHLTGRNFDALCHGSVLVTQDCPEVRDLFHSGSDVITWTTPQTAVKQIADHTRNAVGSWAIRRRGLEQAAALVENQPRLRQSLAPLLEWD